MNFCYCLVLMRREKNACKMLKTKSPLKCFAGSGADEKNR